MATTIYKCQMTKDVTPLDAALTTAMCNEMTHMQDFQTRLYEYGFKPAKLRGRFWLAGYVFGLGSRMMGTERVLKTGIWVENKAVEHYGKLLAGRRMGRRDPGVHREGPGGRVRAYRPLERVP